MSHFVVLVGMTEEEYKDHAEYNLPDESLILQEMLAPYDESIEVPEYDRDCWCIGREARNESRERAKKHWKFEEKREEFNNRAENRDAMPFDREVRERWEEFIEPYIALEERYNREHPLHDQPNSDCDECKGTGKYKSNYNPNSKWDWWTVGGRWDGFCEDFDRIPDDENAAYGSELRDGAKIPWGILVRVDGKLRWNQGGEMGWWGISSNNNKNWDTIAVELLNQFEDRVFVAVDLHI